MDYSWNDDALSMIKLINLLICNLLSSINHVRGWIIHMMISLELMAELLSGSRISCIKAANMSQSDA